MSGMVALSDIASRALAYTKKLLPWTPREEPLSDVSVCETNRGT